LEILETQNLFLKVMAVQFMFVWLNAFSLLIWAHDDHAATYSDDAVSLLQMSTKRTQNSRRKQVIISPTSGAMDFVGRYDVIRHDDQEVVRFDAQGFEMHFQVEGTTEVRMAIEQKISGPGGWYFEHHEEEDYEDGCWEAEPSLVVEHANTWRSSVAMQTSGSQPHHFLVYVNGVPQTAPPSKCLFCTFDTTAAVSGQTKEYTIATGLNPLVTNHIRIVKTSEPDFSTYPVAPNWLSLHALILDQGVARPDVNKQFKRKVEFVGDSWMTGFCDECNGGLCAAGMNTGSQMAGEDSSTFRWGSYALAWPQLLCEDLKANCHSTVLSGVGFRTACHPSWCVPNQTLPMFWERALATDTSSQWDFKAWTPDVLVMLASINEKFDDPPGGIEDPIVHKEEVLKVYSNFMDAAFERYAGVHIFVVCLDSYTTTNMCGAMKNLVNEKKNNGGQADVLDVYNMSGVADVKKCCGHPDMEGHKIIKQHVGEEVRRVMGWRDVQ